MYVLFNDLLVCMTSMTSTHWLRLDISVFVITGMVYIRLVQTSPTCKIVHTKLVFELVKIPEVQKKLSACLMFGIQGLIFCQERWYHHTARICLNDAVVIVCVFLYYILGILYTGHIIYWAYYILGILYTGHIIALLTARCTEIVKQFAYDCVSTQALSCSAEHVFFTCVFGGHSFLF